MKSKPFLLIIAALIGLIIYLKYTANEVPESAVTLTPKEYIQLVEKKKIERLKASKNEAQQSATQVPMQKK